MKNLIKPEQDPRLAGEFTWTSSADPDAFALIVLGDGMEPELFTGDRIVIEPNAQLKDGDIGVVKLKSNGLPLLKRVYATMNGLRLVSTNPKYQPVEVHQTEVVFAYRATEVYRKMG